MPVNTVDLGVTIAGATSSVAAGSAYSYTITVVNFGGDTVSSVNLIDNIPPDLLNPVFAPATGTYDDAFGVWSGLSLSPGDNVSMTLSGTIDPGATGGTTISNTVIVTPPAGETDPNLNNNGDTASTLILAAPTLTTTPNAGLVTLGATSPTPLTDSATLSGGVNPTGTITFTLFQNGGGTPVDTETVTVNGNGTYTTPAGFTLPTTGTLTGTYQWDASYSGDANNTTAADVNNPTEQVTVIAANPTLTTTPNAGLVTLGATSPAPLTDSATLSGGFDPTGAITFELFQNGGGTPVDTETVTVNGNGTYTTPTGFTLPTTGTLTGTYQWDAFYSGDVNNDPAADLNDPAEQVTVSAAAPTLTTTPNAGMVTLGATPPMPLTDTAVLSGGFDPTGTLTFELFHNGGATPVDTETVAVNGNGAYTTPTGFTLPTTDAAGTYQWDVAYSGDADNTATGDQGGKAEQVTVSPASPTLATTTVSSITLDAGVTTLADTASLSGGYFPTGSIVFTLTGPGFSYTQTDTASGNGNYTADTTLPTTGTVAGTYTWSANYFGDANNDAASGSAEQVTVNPASTTLTTTPNAGLVTLGATSPAPLTDSATLSGGFDPTGTITFELFHNGAANIYTVTVNGNGTYTTPTGFTLPTTGTLTGTYQWDAFYSGDVNNDPAADLNDPAEQVTVSAAAPTLTTTPNAGMVTLGATPPMPLTDTAVLSGGFDPTGTLTFELFHNGGATPVDTETVAVNGNGAYTTPTGFTLPTTDAAGTYQWDVAYSGDADNTATGDQGGKAEQVTVGDFSTALSQAPNGAVDFLEFDGTQLLQSDSQFSSWNIRAEGSFNGQTQLVSQNPTTGQIDLLAVNSSGGLQASDLLQGDYWKVVSAGDFDGSGRTGIATQNTQTGQVDLLWFTGTQLTSSELLAQPLPDIVGAADFNADGKTDLVGQTASGQLDFLFFTGSELTGSALTPQSYFPVHDVSNFGALGNTQMVSQNPANSQLDVLNFSGTNLMSTELTQPLAPLPIVPGSTLAAQLFHIG